MLLSLVLLGGQSIKWFSVALLIGAVTGTYSSTFTAVPLLVQWSKAKK
jgi:preprotein translocase subunit SecF